MDRSRRVSFSALGLRAEGTSSPVGRFNDMIMVSQEIRRSGSASLDLCSVAAGRLDGYWELKLQPWDVAAGSLIVREAGGKVSNLNGTGFSIRGRDIVASNGRIHDQLLAILNRQPRPR